MENPKDRLNDKPEIVLKHLYNSNYPWVEKFIRNNSGSAEDAQDVFQESLMAAWVNLKTGRFAGTAENFNAYLRQVCKYKWLTQLRSAAHKYTLYAEDITAFEQETDNPDEIEQQLLKARQLKSSISRLGDKCRDVLNLFYYERRSLTEIAALQGNTEESIKTIKYRCMMQLRKIYLETHSNNG